MNPTDHSLLARLSTMTNLITPVVRGMRARQSYSSLDPADLRQVGSELCQLGIDLIVRAGELDSKPQRKDDRT